jgi:hypothetical protein
VTRPAPEPDPPSGDGRRAVERGGELADAAATVQTLAAHLEASTQHPGRFFYAAYGAAMDRMRDLLASLDEAGAGQADPGGNPPHAYIPAGPVEAAPYEGCCPPEVRQEAFVAWLAQLDDTTCRTIASLMWRCRLAGAEAGRRPR